MPVRVLPTVSTARNGLGSFILQCKKIELGYCNWAGSSKGMNEFLQDVNVKRPSLLSFATNNPQIELQPLRRPHAHPILRASYINGREKVICVRNMKPHEILQKAELLRDASGKKLKKLNHKVESTEESVRGIWSPFHEKAAHVI